MYSYSQFLTTLHDEQQPVGRFGDGTHYSVFRTASWFDSSIRPLKEPMIHDFAVIWDKDHDTQIIDLVEHLYLKNLMAPVLFVGERDGVLSVLVSAQGNESQRQDFQGYVSSVAELAKNQFEPWNVEVSAFGENLPRHRIIDSAEENVDLYLKNIQMLWGLGLKNFSVCLNRPDLSAKPKLEIA